MRKIIYFLFSILSFSCSESEDAFLVQVDKNEINISSDVISGTLHITSNGKWQIGDTPNWIKSNAIQGEGNQEILLSFLENDSFENRSAVIVISKINGTPSDAQANVRITQEQKHVINVVSNLFFGRVGGEQDLSYEENVDAELSCEADWVHIQPSQTRALSKNKKTIVVDENKGSERTAIITLKGKDLVKEVLVKQEGIVPIEDIVLPTIESIQIVEDYTQTFIASIYPENASLDFLAWSVKDPDVLQIEEYGTKNEIRYKPLKNGSTTLTITDKLSGIARSIDANIKIKANKIFIDDNSNWSGEYTQSYTYNCKFRPSFTASPNIAYIEDLIITSSDERVAKVNNGEITTFNYDGDTKITYSLPYSGLSHSFLLQVRPCYYFARIEHVSQLINNRISFSLGGKIYSKRANINIFNVILFNEEGNAVASSNEVSDPSITIENNNSQSVVFHVEKMEDTGKFAPGLQNKLEKWRFFVAYTIDEIDYNTEIPVNSHNTGRIYP